MTIEKKIITTGDPNYKDDSEEIKQQLDQAMIENKKVRGLIDLFILALFLVFMISWIVINHGKFSILLTSKI